MSQCRNYDGNAYCPKEGTRTVTGGCEHEHISTHDLCNAHADYAFSHVLSCNTCLEADGHFCPVELYEEGKPDAANSPWVYDPLSTL